MRTLNWISLSGLLFLTPIFFPIVGADGTPRRTAFGAGQTRWSRPYDLMHWQPFPRPNAPDVSLHRHRLLRLSLGSGATCVPKSIPFYWASVSRVIEVDTGRSPILAVRAVDLKGPSWWDVEVQGCTRPPASMLPSSPVEVTGAEVKTPSLTHGGLVLFDLQAQARNGLQLGNHWLRVRLSIAGTAPGGSVEYKWLRFLRRADAERLRTHSRALT